ncbi:hypothetical protein KGQ19_01380 [Catenulispora sp. NL8]|uniref:Uncharacterized protein n=1 Tax=Catenulispora pinistramenti TaxID=2705254 RepID=A0ABS5KHI8_9ACTN|nr:hypothetical protein [Catenulispora pinistramenti]MBS2545512.1 hypothetical protein [Catenulispora pinistramenti]
MSDKATDQSAADEAILAQLANNEAVVEAARGVWHHSGRLTADPGHRRGVKRDLRAAVDAYSSAIQASRIPKQQARQLGAVLMARLGRGWLIAELDGPTDEP